jgi:glycine/D-amino acid oxidase-like deaminating enzyme
MHVVVVGGGIFGACAALALAERGERVTLVDAGAIPHPLAESTDVSKAVRVDYGADEFYVAEMERALDAWRAWNDTYGETLFHETGTMFVTRSEMSAGGFEHDSFVTLVKRGHALVRLDARAIESQSSLRGFVDGYFNPSGGWAESSRVVECVVRAARDRGAIVRERTHVARVRVEKNRAASVVLAGGDEIAADAFVIATGGWIGALVPEIASSFRTVAQPVFHLASHGAELPVFGADIARTGWCGFPAHRDGFVKIANHGTGRVMRSEQTARDTTPNEISRMRDFLRESLPMLADAEVVRARVCVYCDTADEHFFVARHPDVANLVVATGGSGHGFKFAPRIGEWIARALDGDVVERFRWRTPSREAHGDEARHRGT